MIYLIKYSCLEPLIYIKHKLFFLLCCVSISVWSHLLPVASSYISGGCSFFNLQHKRFLPWRSLLHLPVRSTASCVSLRLPCIPLHNSVRSLVHYFWVPSYTPSVFSVLYNRLFTHYILRSLTNPLCVSPCVPLPRLPIRG